MMLSLHNLAKEYKLLPSEALEKATTFDFKVLDLAVKWEIKKYNEQQGIKESPKVSQEKLLEMLNQVKAKNK
jgi:hypothetical protein